jgi:hypothetical protein
MRACLGLFARAGVADGNIEPEAFTDIDKTLSGGLSLSGKLWGRPDDTFGVAGVINDISRTSTHPCDSARYQWPSSAGTASWSVS